MRNISDNRLKLRLYGSFSAAWDDAGEASITGAKMRALLAILALSPEGRRTRKWLQKTLWGRSGDEHAAASLRRCLMDLRRCFGAKADLIISADKTEIRLHLDHVNILGDGELLEGVDIAEDGWLTFQRAHLLRPPASRAGLAKTEIVVEDKVAPKVAILPFMPLGGHATAHGFADLLAMEASRSLSHSSFVDVVSHLSSRAYTGDEIDVVALKDALDIDYCLYGTVYTDGDQFVLNADLINAQTGVLMANRRFTGGQLDIMKGESAVAVDMAAQVANGLHVSEIGLAQTAPLPEVPTHTLFMSAIGLMHRLKLAPFSLAKKHFAEVLRRAPGNSMALAWFAKWYILSIAQGWSVDTKKDCRIAADLVARALDVNPLCSFSLATDGMVLNHLNKEDLAEQRFRSAVEIEPSNAFAHLMYARLLFFTDQGEASVSHAERALRLSPRDPQRYLYLNFAAAARCTKGDYRQALNYIDASLAENPNHTSSLRVRTITLGLLGEEEKARDSARELLQMEPGLTVKGYLNSHPAANKPNGRLWADMLALAGVPKT